MPIYDNQRLKTRKSQGTIEYWTHLLRNLKSEIGKRWGSQRRCESQCQFKNLKSNFFFYAIKEDIVNHLLLFDSTSRYKAWRKVCLREFQRGTQCFSPRVERCWVDGFRYIPFIDLSWIHHIDDSVQTEKWVFLISNLFETSWTPSVVQFIQSPHNSQHFRLGYCSIIVDVKYREHHVQFFFGCSSTNHSWVGR